MVVGSPSRDSAPCDERGMEKQVALEISKRTVVHGDRLGRYAPFAALRGPSRGAVAWGNRCEDAHLDIARFTKLSINRSWVNIDQVSFW